MNRHSTSRQSRAGAFDKYVAALHDIERVTGA